MSYFTQNDPISLYINGASTTLVKSGAGKLHRVIINDGPVNTTITLYNSLTGTGTIIAQLQLNTAVANSVEFNVPFTVGLTVVIVGATNATIVYE